MSRRRPAAELDAAAAHAAAPEAAAPGAGADLLRNAALGMLAAMYIATPLLPTEGAAATGSGVVLVMLWLILAAIWLVEGMLRGRLELRCGWTGTALMALVGWHIVSTLVMAREGTPRPAINTAWEWVSLGLGFLLARSLVRTEKEVRAFIAVMIGLAVCLAIFSFYETLYTIPQRQAAYREDPQKALRDAGIVAERGSPLYQNFENRIMSEEPTATFALTNSLAGFLAVWMTMGIGLLLIAWHDPRMNKSVLAGIGLALLALVFSLLLTKSRTGYIAAAIGGGLMWMYGRANIGRSFWMAPILAGGLVLLLGMGAAFTGSVDSEVVSEAPKSVVYRLQYWQATMHMINDHPLYGVGPGNFQDYYTQYQLAQASESVADPHNFLLEIWSTAGSPAVLALLAALACFMWETARGSILSLGREDDDLAAAAEKEESPRRRTQPEPTTSGPPGHWFILGGAVMGVFMSLPLNYLVGYGPEPALLYLALPLAALCVYLLYPWIESGPLPVTVPAIAILALLINLLAAGGINFPGIAGSLWLLMALGLQLVEKEKPPLTAPAPVALAGLAIIFLLGIACHQTAYEPVLVTRGLLAQGDAQMLSFRFDEAERFFTAAAKADPYSPDPWQRLAGLRLARWQSAPASLRSAEIFGTFEDAVSQATKLAKHSSAWQQQIGNWYLDGYRDTGSRSLLDKSVAAHRKAADLFPHSSVVRAQLAWTLHVAGDATSADEAAQALRLDEQNKHQERVLANLKVHDPGPSAGQPRSAMAPGPDRNAGDLMKMLRR